MTAHLDHASTLRASVRACGLSEVDLDSITCGFLGSEFTSLIYANWPIERCVDAYLAHHGMINLLNNGDAHAALMQSVLANTGVAARDGTLPTTTSETSNRPPARPKPPQRQSTAPDGDTIHADHDGEHSGRADRARGPICATAGASRTAMGGSQYG